MSHVLRPYQVRTIDAVRAAWREGARRILVVSPTGSGKTTIGCAVLESATKRGRRFLWLTHRRELVAQTSERLAHAGVHHGVILAGAPRRADAPIQVCSIQTLTAEGQAPDGIDGVVIDEAHHATCGTYRSIVSVYPKLELVMGLTATPERADRTPLGDVFERIVVACSVRDLQTIGALCPVEVYAPPKFQEGLRCSPLAAYRERLDGRRAIVFCGSVAHAEMVANEFRAAGIAAANVDGTTPKSSRDDYLAGLASGRIKVLSNVGVLTEGTDIPSIEGVIMARGCSAWSTWIQSVGRGLRPSPATGKTRCVVEDLKGAVYAHGMPDDVREFSLGGKASREAKDALALSSCRACGAVYRWVPACPRCGEKATPLPPPRVQRAAGERVTEVRVGTWSEKRKHFEELCKTARERGYKPAWIGMQFKARWSHWPVWRVEARSA